LPSADALVARNPEAGPIRPTFEHRFTDAQQFFLLNRWSAIAIGEYGNDSAQ
jgi:hypothetical protein